MGKEAFEEISQIPMEEKGLVFSIALGNGEICVLKEGDVG